MGFICGVLLMYMAEDDVLPPVLQPVVNDDSRRRTTTPNVASLRQAFLMLISLLENYRMAGLFMRDPQPTKYETIHMQVRSCAKYM